MTREDLRSLAAACGASAMLLAVAVAVIIALRDVDDAAWHAANDATLGLLAVAAGVATMAAIAAGWWSLNLAIYRLIGGRR